MIGDFFPTHLFLSKVIAVCDYFVIMVFSQHTDDLFL